MPVRRTHHKSRNGCVQCKKRHVKCDEALPACGNCAKREVLDCTYDKIVRSHSENEDQHDSPQITEKDKSDSYICSRIQELDLMHHYVTFTYKTFASDPKDWHMWEVSIPRMAFEYTYLLDAILAITCLHRGSLDPRSKQSWSKRGLEYQNRALASFRENALNNIDEDSCHAAFAFSILTSFNVVATPHQDPIEQILALRSHFQGTTVIARSMGELLSKGVMRSMFEPHTVDWNLDPNSLKSIDGRLHALFEISANEPEAAILHTAISEMINIFRNHPLGVIGYPLYLHEEFIQLLHQRKHMAIIIFVYYGVILDLIKEWWAEHVGEHLVNSLSIPGNVLESNPKLSAALSWARQQVGLKPESSQSQTYKPSSTKKTEWSAPPSWTPGSAAFTPTSHDGSAATTPNNI